MKELIFNRKDYNTYKDFYSYLYKNLNGDSMIDWSDCKDLNYHAGHLYEFLWYCVDDNYKFTFVNFDKEKIALQKTYDDYEYSIIIKIFEEFVKKYPNNSLEFKTSI